MEEETAESNRRVLKEINELVRNHPELSESHRRELRLLNQLSQSAQQMETINEAETYCFCS